MGIGHFRRQKKLTAMSVVGDGRRAVHGGQALCRRRWRGGALFAASSALPGMLSGSGAI